MASQEHADLLLDIYGRVSRKRDMKAKSVDSQIAAGRRAIAARGWHAGEVLRDDGRSAWTGGPRPGWDALMERLGAEVTDGAWVYELARYTRQPREAEEMIAMLATRTRPLLLVSSQITYDLYSYEDRKRVRDIIASAAYYSDVLSDAVARGKRDRAHVEHLPNGKRGFGRRVDGTVVEEEAAILREAASRALDGEADADIVRDLRERGITGLSGAPVSQTALRRWLVRPSVAGILTHQGEEVGTMEPIIDRADWERLVAQRAARAAGRQPSHRYLAVGYVDCAPCARPLTGRLEAPLADGTRKRAYGCYHPASSRLGTGCLGSHILAEVLEEWLRDLVIDRLSDARAAAARAVAQGELAARSQQLAARLEELETIAVTLAERLGRGEISLARHDAAVLPLDRQAQQLRAELAALPAPSSVPMTPADPAEVARTWDHPQTTTGQRRAMIASALAGARVLVHPTDVLPRISLSRGAVGG